MKFRYWSVFDTMTSKSKKKKKKSFFVLLLLFFFLVKISTFISCNPFSFRFAMFVVLECNIIFFVSYDWHKDSRLSSSSVPLVLPLLKSEAGWTGELLLILENKEKIIFLAKIIKYFFWKKSFLLKFSAIFPDLMTIFDNFQIVGVF